MPTDSDADEIVRWRRWLHARPELSGEERETAAAVVAMLAPTTPDRLLADLGGHGVAAVYEGREAGPTVMVRAELDGLPIEETGAVPHRSRSPGKAHLCGHDGHTATLLLLARRIAGNRPARGRTVLLFQPAEETGTGAGAMLADPRFLEIAPDYAFALHNYPGVAIGRAALKSGPVNCASAGLKITLLGRTAHAAEPSAAVSPLMALVRLLPALADLGTPHLATDDPRFTLATVTHARLGQPAFGITPGEGEARVQLRALRDAPLAALVAEAEELARREADAAGLGLALSRHEAFAACANDADATARLAAGLDAIGVPHAPFDLPMRASEDFGLFGHGARAAMVFLGAGEDHPRLHAPDYDFPDALVPLGAALFERVVRDTLA